MTIRHVTSPCYVLFCFEFVLYYLSHAFHGELNTFVVLHMFCIACAREMDTEKAYDRKRNGEIERNIEREIERER